MHFSNTTLPSSEKVAIGNIEGMDVAVSQQNFIYKNRWWAGFGPGAEVFLAGEGTKDLGPK